MNIRKFRVSIFRWVQDEDGDIGLEVFGLITFLKYKENTIIELFKRYKKAPKYVS